VNAQRGARFFASVVEAFADADLQVILVAPPQVVGAVPEHVLVRERVPQLALLEHVDAVVCHGGHNTVCEALAQGLPLVVAPIRDDQPIVAEQVVRSGAGIRVHFGRVRPADLRSAVERVLGEPSYREAAQRIRQSFAAAGGPERAAELLEKLA
jgi:MGT family glycosyltransferase